ncbi:MAG TPA: hypothetical protein VE972_14840 [Conexibacter sp.]|nr:hypothetical protein [Conexibacter sp.]
MANDALFIGWGAVARGREQTSLKVFQETVEFWAKAQQDGRIDGFEPYLLQPHGGGLAGFMLLTGQRAQLDELRSSAEFANVMARAGMVVDELGVVSAYGGEALAQQLGVFQQAASGLG